MLRQLTPRASPCGDVEPYAAHEAQAGRTGQMLEAQRACSRPGQTFWRDL